MGINERNSVQDPVIDRLAQLGWEKRYGERLHRELEDVFLDEDLVDALMRLNPVIAERPERAAEIVKLLRTHTLAAENDGLVAANAQFMRWMRGLVHHKFVGETEHVPIHLIDFEDLSRNRFVVADEVTFGGPGRKARFDIVLYVNGLPVVVGETKTAVDRSISWVSAVKEITGHYEVEYPAFFVPNVFSFGTEGKELACGPVGAPSDAWEVWGPTQTEPRLRHVLESVSSLMAPATVLAMLNDFTLFEQPEDNSSTELRKLIARYMQFDAVQLMADRAHEGVKKRGLIYHTQGTGKTLAMVFAAAKMLRDPALRNPTIVLIADRVQLVGQMWDQFRTTGMPRLQEPQTAQALQTMLGSKANGGLDQRGLIFTTIHKFARAQNNLNTRENIIVLVDEAHRTQEGSLGVSMRGALPNATMFAFSGTPLATLDRNTFETFGEPTDDGKTLHKYTSDQAIADGVVVPIHVAPRLVRFQLDKAGLDQAFKDLAAQEGLTDEESEVLARRANRVSTFFTSPERIRTVCADIIDHFYSTVDPLGMKAQLVVFDRAACVAYHQELTHQLADRAAQAGVEPDEARVVMTVGGAKDEDKDWQEYQLSDVNEEAVLKRFRTYGDPLKFLIVTSKLGTGFNAPIEGVMYLDKPLKAHTLFQTITRANRTWKNPETGQAKRYGLIVDYVGLGDGFARAMAPANPDQEQDTVEIAGLLDMFERELGIAMLRFTGINVTDVKATTLLDAQSRLPDKKAEEDFAAQFNMLAGIWETIAPDARLAPHRAAYTFLAKVYASIQPPGGRDDLLWARLGAKTLDLVHSHMTDVRTETDRSAVVIADADTINKLKDEGLLPEVEDAEHRTADEVVDSIAERLKKRLAGKNGDHPVYKSLAERLDRLRERQLTAAQQSIDWLRELFTVAKDLKAAENAEDENGREGLNVIPDPRIGALTQIFHEYAPPGTPGMIEKVVHEIDEIVRQVTADNTGWALTQKGDRAVRREVRAILKDHELHQVPALFDRAYEYIAEHY